MLQRIKDNPTRWFILFTILMLIGTSAAIFLLSYQVTYLDYRTGRVRIHHMIGNWKRKTTVHNTWVSFYVPSTDSADWHLIGYQNQKLQQIMINSKGGKIVFQIHSFFRYLTNARANEESKKLVAQFIIDQLNRPGDEGDVFAIADRSFDCFFEELPFPEDSTDELTTEEVRETIRLCTNLNSSPTISP